MIDFLSYTVFADREMTTIRGAYNLYGEAADRTLRIFRRGLGKKPRVGDVLWLCRIDRIRSEDPSERAA